MNSKIANDLFGYFQTLYEVNKKFIMLCGHDCNIPQQENTKVLLDLIQDLFKLLPFMVERNKDCLRICKQDGLLEYREEFDFLYDDYKKLLSKFHSEICKLKSIRNKYEHKMHALKATASGDGTFTMFEFLFEVKEKGKLKEITISYYDLKNLLKEINVIFSKIQYKVSKYTQDENKQHYYYTRLNRVNFIEFNQIIESGIVRTVGKIMFDF